MSYNVFGGMLNLAQSLNQINWVSWESPKDLMISLWTALTE